MSQSLYAIQQQQMQRTFGELRALLALHFDPMNPRDESYKRLEKLVEETIEEITNEIG